MKEYGFTTGVNTLQAEVPANQKEINHEYETEHNPLTYARELIRDISQSPEFLDSGYGYGYDMSDSNSLDYQYHLASITLDYVKDNGSFFLENYGPDTLAAIKMLGTAPYAFSQQNILDSAEKNHTRLDRETYSHAKDTMVEFNHGVYELIESNPRLKLDEVAVALSKTVGDYANFYHAHIHKKANEILRGLRTEFGFKTVVDASGMVNIRHADTHQDRKGIDFVVSTLDGETTINIDLKTSMKGVDKKSNYTATDDMPFTQARDGNFVYYPYIEDTAYTKGTFALKKSAIDGLTIPIMSNLQKMVQKAS